jgi:phosphonate transport system substrate-binding protein
VVAHTPANDHCNFTVLDGAPAQQVHRFRELLLGMSYSDPEVRPLLDMEGLKQWQPGRTEGYAALDVALRRFGTVDEFVKAVVAQCK